MYTLHVACGQADLKGINEAKNYWQAYFDKYTYEHEVLAGAADKEAIVAFSFWLDKVIVRVTYIAPSYRCGVWSPLHMLILYLWSSQGHLCAYCLFCLFPVVQGSVIVILCHCRLLSLLKHAPSSAVSPACEHCYAQIPNCSEGYGHCRQGSCRAHICSQLSCIQRDAQVYCQFQSSLLMQLRCLHAHTISQVRLNRP